MRLPIERASLATFIHQDCGAEPLRRLIISGVWHARLGLARAGISRDSSDR